MNRQSALLTSVLLLWFLQYPLFPQSQMFHLEDEDKTETTTAMVRGGAARSGSADSDIIDSSPSLKWTFPSVRFVTAPVIWDNRIFCSSKNGTLYCIDLQTGEERWQFQGQGKVRSSVAISKNAVFAGTDEGILYVLKLTDARILWTVPLDGAVLSSVVVKDNNIYCTTARGTLYGIDFKEKRTIFAVHGVSAPRTGPSVGASHVITVSKEKAVHSFARSTGKKLWSYKTKNRVFAPPAIYNQTAYIQGPQDPLVALNITTGKKRWSLRLPGLFYQPLATSVFHLYAADTNQSLYCVDLHTGKKKWQTIIGAPPQSPPITVGHTVIIGCGNLVYCFDGNTGKTRWQILLRKSVELSPAAYKERLVVVDMSGSLMVFR